MKNNVNARSIKELTYDQEMEAANNIVERQNSLENFISDEVGQFLTGRNLRVLKKLLKLTNLHYCCLSILNNDKMIHRNHSGNMKCILM